MLISVITNKRLFRIEVLLTIFFGYLFLGNKAFALCDTLTTNPPRPIEVASASDIDSLTVDFEVDVADYDAIPGGPFEYEFLFECQWGSNWVPATKTGSIAKRRIGPGGCSLEPYEHHFIVRRLGLNEVCTDKYMVKIAPGGGSRCSIDVDPLGPSINDDVKATLEWHNITTASVADFQVRRNVRIIDDINTPDGTKTYDFGKMSIGTYNLEAGYYDTWTSTFNPVCKKAFRVTKLGGAPPPDASEECSDPFFQIDNAEQCACELGKPMLDKAGSPVPVPHPGKLGTWTALGCIPNEPQAFAEVLLRIIIGMSSGIAFLVLLKGALLILTSQGDPEKINQGKDWMTSAVLGLIFMAFSTVILAIIGVDILRIPGFVR